MVWALPKSKPSLREIAHLSWLRVVDPSLESPQFRIEMRYRQDEGPGQAIERLQGKKLTKSQEPCKMKSFNKLPLFAGVAELADAQDLGCSPSHFPTSLLSVSACVFIAR